MTWIASEMVSKEIKEESDEQRQIGKVRMILDQRITFANSVGGVRFSLIFVRSI